MGHRVFIPVSDELLFDRPDLIKTPLRPFKENMACYHWMDIRLNPEDDAKIAESYNKLKIQKREQDLSLSKEAA